MSPGERGPQGRREPARPQYASQAPGYPPSYYPPYGVPHPNAWLGAPLISMAGRAPQQRHTPISKLAIQAQGAPLIIQNKQDRRKFTSAEQRSHRLQGTAEQNSNPTKDRCERLNDNNRPRNQQHQHSRVTRGGRAHNTDAVSVASDESSGSNNSETMLPRIIKPRKRRKKDRKPNNMAPHDLASVNLDADIEQHCNINGVTPTSHVYDENYRRDLSYRLDVKVFEYADPVPESYKVSALGEALEATRFGVAEAVSPAESAVSSCQCRYCDPVGQIWDAESIAGLLDETSTGDFAPTTLDESMKVVGPMARRADTTLRRSWSDPFARTPERRDACEPSSSAPNLYSLFPPTHRAGSPQEFRPTLSLEISSEIVTSINGHRDLEIKLFSKSPPAVSSERRSFFSGSSESDALKSNDLKVKSVVLSGKVDNGVNASATQKCEELPESGCSSAFSSGGFSRNQCDLTLVTV